MEQLISMKEARFEVCGLYRSLTSGHQEGWDNSAFCDDFVASNYQLSQLRASLSVCVYATHRNDDGSGHEMSEADSEDTEMGFWELTTVEQLSAMSRHLPNVGEVPDYVSV